VSHREPASPSPFVLDHVPAMPPGPVLDVACGAGRHALAVARTGRLVDAIDRSEERCLEVARRAAADRLRVRTICADLEQLPLPAGRYAGIINTLYLDRALVPRLVRALAPGGVLVFETFTAAQLATGHPRNPAFVLAPGELRRLAAGLEVLAYREGPGARDGTTVHLAALAARLP
jgi:SAM-dependent methyltransferase